MSALADCLSETEQVEIAQLVRAVVPGRRRPRWLTILGTAPPKWRTLRMDDVFESEPSDRVMRVEIAAALAAHRFQEDVPAFLMRLSRPPHILRGRVSELVELVVDDDAIILVPDAKVAFAAHHHDGWLECRYARRG